MRNLDRRLRALEAESKPCGWGAYFDTMPDADLFRLETIISALPPIDRTGEGEVVAALDALDDQDAAFLESVLKGREAMRCAV